MPGASNLAGTLDANERDGRLHIDTQAASFTLPKLFAEPIAFDTLRGDVAWQNDGSESQLAVQGRRVCQRRCRGNDRRQLAPARRQSRRRRHQGATVARQSRQHVPVPAAWRRTGRQGLAAPCSRERYVERREADARRRSRAVSVCRGEGRPVRVRREGAGRHAAVRRRVAADHRDRRRRAHRGSAPVDRRFGRARARRAHRHDPSRDRRSARGAARAADRWRRQRSDGANSWRSSRRHRSPAGLVTSPRTRRRKAMDSSRSSSICRCATSLASRSTASTGSSRMQFACRVCLRCWRRAGRSRSPTTMRGRPTSPPTHSAGRSSCR